MIAAFTTIISGASVDIFVPSLPAIHSAFSASMQATQLMVPIYILAYGIFQWVAGGIADSFGHRKTMLTALIGFVIVTLAVPFSPNIAGLLCLRFMQGIFTAGIGICSRALISDTFSGTTLSKYATYLTFTWALGPICSPYLGGYLQHFFGWESAFYFLGAYACLTALLVYQLLPETAPIRHCFYLHTILTNYFTIYSHKIFILGAFACGCAYGFITLYHVSGPFLIQHTLGYSPVVYGHIALFLGVGWLSGNLLCRLAVTRQSPGPLVIKVLTIGVCIAACMVYLAYNHHFTLWSTVLPPILLFIVAGMVFAYCFGQCLRLFPHIAGTASAAMGALFYYCCPNFCIQHAVKSQYPDAISIELLIDHTINICFVYFTREMASTTHTKSIVMMDKLTIHLGTDATQLWISAQ